MKLSFLSASLVVLIFFSTGAMANFETYGVCGEIGQVEGGGLTLYNQDGLVFMRVSSGGMAGGEPVNAEVEIKKQSQDGKCIATLRSKPNAGGSFAEITVDTSGKSASLTAYKFFSTPMWITMAKIQSKQDTTHGIPVSCQFEKNFETQLGTCGP